MLSKTQFSVLTAIEAKKQDKLTQREIATLTGLSLGAVNKACTYFNDENFLLNGKLTEKAYEALSPYRVKRAVFLAAGFGSRLVPITLNTPKPLVKVHGVKMIETLLDAVTKAEIEEIIVVRGYLSEQFNVLLEKYPNIKFLENSLYNETNNISSAYIARNLLQNSYILEADLVLSNLNLITKYQYSSNYVGVPVEKTDDWCFKVKNDRIVKMKLGGTNCYHMFGISYWNQKDGEKLGQLIEKVFYTPGGKERYWDQVALEYYINEFYVSVRPCTFNDVVEIDSFCDLKKIDPIYDC